MPDSCDTVIPQEDAEEIADLLERLSYLVESEWGRGGVNRRAEEYVEKLREGTE